MIGQLLSPADRMVIMIARFYEIRLGLKRDCTFSQHLRPVLPEDKFSRSVLSNTNSPATDPPAAAETEYSKLLMQKAAVVLLLSTIVSRIKQWLVMKTPSLKP